MRILSFFLLGLVFSCSSGKVKDSTSTQVQGVNKESFKKEKTLNSGEFKDFFHKKEKSLNPALQDETLDRYTAEELAKMSDSADPLIEIALRCSKKDFNNAFAAANKVFNRYQKIPAYWNLIANCHLNQGSGRKALLFYNKAIEVSPRYVPALNNIGVYYSRIGEDQKALLAFEKANRQSPFSKTPRYNLARLYLSYGLVESALPLFKGLLHESLNDLDLINAVGSCYFLMSDYQSAFSHFNRIPATILSNAEFGLNFALTLKKLGKVPEAEKLYSNIDEPKNRDLKEYYTSIGNQLGVNK